MFLNGSSVVRVLWISSCVKVHRHSALQLCIHMAKKAVFPPSELRSLSCWRPHTQSPLLSSGSHPEVAPVAHSTRPKSAECCIGLLLAKTKHKQSPGLCVVLRERIHLFLEFAASVPVPLSRSRALFQHLGSKNFS